MMRTERTITCEDAAVRAMFPLAILLASCRDKPKPLPEPPPAVVDSGAPDTLAAALDELLDASGDVALLTGDVTIEVAKIEPKGAYSALDLAAQRWRFRRCYVDAGTERVTVRVGEGGEPVSADGAACVAEAAKKLTFPEPNGGFATVELNLRFTAK
jgi:hypothetical protein